MTPAQPSGTVTSKDGTIIAYDRVGDGAPLVLVVGAFNDRTTGADLAQALAATYTVFTYDRRGRGGSGNTLPWSVDREIEDLNAMIEIAGGSASVLGFSSGAMLALIAAAGTLPVNKLAMLDLPIVTDNMRPVPSPDFSAHIQSLIDAGKRSEAVDLFQIDYVGIPREYVEQMKEAPFRPGLEAMAHTLVYDTAIMGDLSLPEETLSAIRQPTLVLDGGDPPWMHHSADMVASKIVGSRRVTIADLGHNLTAAIAPALREFLA